MRRWAMLGAKMLRNKTVFVIGAGASAEVGLPVGSQLANQIKSLLSFKYEFGRVANGDEEFDMAMLNAAGQDGRKLNLYRQSASQIVESIHSADSIDALIDRFKDSPIIGAIGKAAIVKLICQREAKSKLKNIPRTGLIEIDNASQTWYAVLSKILYHNLSIDGVDNVFDKL